METNKTDAANKKKGARPLTLADMAAHSLIFPCQVGGWVTRTGVSTGFGKLLSVTCGCVSSFVLEVFVGLPGFVLFGGSSLLSKVAKETWVPICMLFTSLGAGAAFLIREMVQQANVASATAATKSGQKKSPR